MKKLIAQILIPASASLALGLASTTLVAEEHAAPASASTEGTAANGNGIAQKIDDAALTARVKSRLLMDKNINGLSINVDTNQSAVTLNGTVKSDTERALAEQVARETKGVRLVQNQLRIASSGDEARQSSRVVN